MANRKTMQVLLVTTVAIFSLLTTPVLAGAGGGIAGGTDNRCWSGSCLR